MEEEKKVAFTVRLPKSVHVGLKAYASVHGLDLFEACEQAVKQFIFEGDHQRSDDEMYLERLKLFLNHATQREKKMAMAWLDEWLKETKLQVRTTIGA